VRRNHLSSGFVICAILAITSPLPANAGGGDVRNVQFRTRTMGTWGSLLIATTDSASVSDIAYRTLLAFHHVDSLMSNWTNDSEVARITREAPSHTITIHPEVAAVLAAAERVSRESGGAFDITVEPLVRLWGFIGGPARVPAQKEIDAALAVTGHDKIQFDEEAGTLRFARAGVSIDLGGIAKGYGVDLAADVLRDAGVANALVDLSGNMFAIGNAATHDGWSVGVRDPAGEHPYLARILLHEEAVATSGDYEQFVDENGKHYGHILDPRTGWSARGLSSVTVIAPRAALADAWATALFVLGAEDARRFAHERSDLSVVLIEPFENGKDIIWVEEQLRSRFVLEPTLEGTMVVRYF